MAAVEFDCVVSGRSRPLRRAGEHLYQRLDFQEREDLGLVLRLETRNEGGAHRPEFLDVLWGGPGPRVV